MEKVVSLPSPRKAKLQPHLHTKKVDEEVTFNLLKLKSRLKRKGTTKKTAADEDGSNKTEASSVGTEMRRAQARAAALKLRRKKASHASLRSPSQQQTTPLKQSMRQNLVSSPYNRISQGLISSYEASPKLPVPKTKSYEQQRIDLSPREMIPEAPLSQKPPMAPTRSNEQRVYTTRGGIITSEETTRQTTLISPSGHDFPSEKPVSQEQLKQNESPSQKLDTPFQEQLVQSESPSQKSHNDVNGKVSQKLQPPKVLSLDVDDDRKTEDLPPQVSTVGESKVSQSVASPQTRYLDVPEPEKTDRPSIFRKPKFWTIIFLLVQIGFYVNYPDLLGSVLSAFVYVSEESILLCKDKLGIEPNLIERITKVEVEVEVEPEPRIVIKNITDSSQVMEHIESLMAVKEVFAAESNAAREEKSNEMTESLLSIKDQLNQRRVLLEDWNVALKNAEEEIRQLVASPPQHVEKNIIDYDVAETLEKLYESSKMEVETEIVTADIPMWEIIPTDSTPSCRPESTSTGNDPIVTSDQISERVNMLQEEALRQVNGAFKDKMIKDVMKVRIEAELEAMGVPEDNIKREVDYDEEEEEESELLIGFTREEGRKMINEGVNNHLAERIGPGDIASLFNGAQILHTGPRATSPSLTESLPLLNRLMAYTKVRQYGYGAEAALTPTVPADAVGQCWAFENVSKSKSSSWRNAYQRDRSNGSFASLTIRFAKPISPKRVVVEHVKSEGKPLSAIRSFRIIGYQDEDALGIPMNLGNFLYNSDGNLSQEFFLGEASTEVRSVTLAIDSAYRRDFACLYRFRVIED
mmetsp:Transcript_19178/g.28924  ORF Transcript_19178/g.28924 Transcript_19178/m.28924 type:complete len:808 (-) Transcript_19178:53-2476(-)|eukprot:CAMPEP_0178920808 /NCGR_PEP_ID=MMETSP0786-20121207/15205_1 /TAXON_ID=186022 /ORGANISM="Thalassionema frauenfeldii, Strain CCMP 1798" /LENGTH=807 /DNA_ID=CAMNT_0020594905 /DNA_START=99 /DNA_END=2522 /DNA_ORIENTATION=+